MGCCSSHNLRLTEEVQPAPIDYPLFQSKPEFEVPNLRIVSQRKGKKLNFIDLQKFVIKRKGRASEFYIIQELIGQGGYGQVYKANHTPTGTFRALKFVGKEQLNPTQIARLRHEFYFIKKLDHPHIMRIFEIIENDDYICLATQYYEGKTINNVLQEKGPFDEVTTARIISQLLLALNYCHLNKLVHRDIKADNCLFMEENLQHLVLIDFGNSANLYDGKMLKRLTGTIHYMAPEVFDGKYNEKVDIWSVGVLIFRMLSGHYPFQGSTMSNVAQNIKKLSYEFNPFIWNKISPEVKDLINSIFTIQAKLRPTAHQILNGPWIQKFFVNSVSESVNMGNFVNELQQNATDFTSLRAVSSSLLWQSGRLNSWARTATLYFNKLDKDQDGVVSREEMKQELIKAKNIDNDEVDISQVLNQIGFQGQGQIQFSQFISMVCGQQWKFDNENIEAIFGMLDTDGRGILFLKDFKEKLGKKIAMQVYSSLVARASSEINGITLKLFKELLLSSSS